MALPFVMFSLFLQWPIYILNCLRFLASFVNNYIYSIVVLFLPPISLHVHTCIFSLEYKTDTFEFLHNWYFWIHLSLLMLIQVFMQNRIVLVTFWHFISDFVTICPFQFTRKYKEMNHTTTKPKFINTNIKWNVHGYCREIENPRKGID